MSRPSEVPEYNDGFRSSVNYGESSFEVINLTAAAAFFIDCNVEFLDSIAPGDEHDSCTLPHEQLSSLNAVQYVW